MFKNKRMVIAICCILGAAIVASAFILTQKISLGNKTEVVVLRQNVIKGEQITEGKVELVKRTTDEVSETAVTDMKAVVGAYATSNLFANDVITMQKISQTPVNGDNLIATMAKDKIAISVPVEGAKGFNGKLESGDIVQVFVKNPEYEIASEKERIEQNLEKMILDEDLQYMRILSITFSDYTEAETKVDGGTYGVVTFECSEYQANKIMAAADNGMHLAYVCHGDNERAASLLAAQENLNAGKTAS